MLELTAGKEMVNGELRAIIASISSFLGCVGATKNDIDLISVAREFEEKALFSTAALFCHGAVTTSVCVMLETLQPLVDSTRLSKS